MANNCSRCQGLLIVDWDEALGSENVRCVMCSFRPNDPPPRPPDPHHLRKERVSNLVTCRCGEPKVEWRSYCRKCSLNKLNAEQRRKHAVKQAIKEKKISKGRSA